MPEQLLEIQPVGQADGPAQGFDGAALDRIADPSAERRARDELRRQIALLEKRLGELFASAFPRAGIEWNVPAVGGPRVLGMAELERVRDGLAVRLRDAQAELARQGEIEEANRGLLESMIAAPDRYRWVRVAAEDIGERPCQHWHSRPRWGILGMLFGWWRVKHSSGCPLAAGLAAPLAKCSPPKVRSPLAARFATSRARSLRAPGLASHPLAFRGSLGAAAIVPPTGSTR